MKPKTILTYLLIGFTTILFSQTQSKSTKSLDIGLGDGTPCTNMGFGCQTNKTTAQMRFDKENNELTLVFSKTSLDTDNKAKILSNELEKDFYLYSFDIDYALPNEIVTALDIKGFSKIKHGDYLVKVQGDQIILKLKLE